MKRLLLAAIVSLAAVAAFAAEPAPAWRPSPDMIGTFRAVFGSDVFTVAPDGHCELSLTYSPSLAIRCVGTLRPDPDGGSNRFLTDLRCNDPAPDDEDWSRTVTCLFSFAPADRAWQMLSKDDGSGDVVSLEAESSMTVDGILEHDDRWFARRFVPDPASFDWAAAPDAARRHFTGTWKNLGDGDGATMALSPDGTGTIENKNMALAETCTWWVVRLENGWRIICEIMERNAPSAQPALRLALLESDARFRRLRLVNGTYCRELAMASNYQESLSDPDPTCFDRIADTPPAEPAAQEDPPSAP